MFHSARNMVHAPATQAEEGTMPTYVVGRYDILIVSEGPDDETAGKIALSLASLGNVRTETFRAFTEAEFRKMVGALR